MLFRTLRQKVEQKITEAVPIISSISSKENECSLVRALLLRIGRYEEGS